ncbi:diguanylate phosphodiesterase [Pseudomonas sp. RIT-PI-q]|uniref:EAL domain-containing protein n=1 Tax=Pseudomonas sp. RIT-PI-q TaxID=1690247 RepID=UPI0006CC5D45|nr:EAL domain-containing protein [Pseudomonas sp. RIT-PI-q]KPH00191.1 diguanylate phosphodiesterase [Pseudomonas sp. RIT-PI-q]
MFANVVVPHEFSALSVITLAPDAFCANRLASSLHGMGVTALENFDSLSAVTARLGEAHVDVIVCEIRAECGDGLMLPSLLKSLHEAGTLSRFPRVFWTGETTLDPAPVLIDGTASRPHHSVCAKHWIKRMGGVPISSLESHARLARAAGIVVEILREGGAMDLCDALRALVDGQSKKKEQADTATFDALAEDDVISALTTGKGLRFVYQPQHDLLTRRVVGAEAFVRWHHPKHGDVPPSVLIPLVHRLGLDLLLFSLVEAWTIKVLLALKKAHIEIPIAVNASAQTICTPNFAERLAARMREAGLPAKLMKIELTEDVPAADELHLSASLTAIRSKGFLVSMDDFGTGSATLKLLTNLSFDEMKIDGSFVREIQQAPSSRKVIAGIVSWARLLNLNLVAEGIEDEQTIALLYRLGCRVGQGYALARPMEMDDFFDFLVREDNVEPNADVKGTA